MKILFVIAGIVLGHIFTLIQLTLDLRSVMNPLPIYSSSEPQGQENLMKHADPDPDQILGEQTSNPPQKILCFILTHPDNHETRAQHAARTWGKRCDKLLIMSSKADSDLGITGLPVEEGYQMLWNKTKEAFKYVYKHYLKDFDWIVKADDDTFIIMENLRAYLRPKNPQQELFFGCRLIVPRNEDTYYNMGGSGYVLSKPAVKRLVEEGFPDPKICLQGPQGYEDAEISWCLSKLGIKPESTRDSLGKLRFVPFDLKFHTMPEEYAAISSAARLHTHILKNNTLPSKDAISFHKVSGADMYLLEYLLYRVKLYSGN